MKKVRFYLLAAMTLGVMSCGGNQTAETTEVAAEEVEVAEVQEETVTGEVYTVNVAESKVEWKGTKLVGEGHNGYISLKEGSLEIAEGSLVGGSFVVDMTTMVNEDLPDEETKAKLIGHLSTGDFFVVDEFPTSALVIKSVSEGTIVADLTIKDKTNEVTFPYELTVSEGNATATGTLKFDRTKFGVVYGSGNFVENLAKDKIINDEIELVISLVAAK